MGLTEVEEILDSLEINKSLGEKKRDRDHLWGQDI